MKDAFCSSRQAYIPASVTIISDEQARIAYQERNIAISDAQERITYAALSGDRQALKTAKLALNHAQQMATPFTYRSFIRFKQTMLANDPIFAFIADIVDITELELFVSHHPECLTVEDSLPYHEGTPLAVIIGRRKADSSTVIYNGAISEE